MWLLLYLWIDEDANSQEKDNKRLSRLSPVGFASSLRWATSLQDWTHLYPIPSPLL
ncbi:hypothetical protein [Anabaena azotica]|uniref:hypothetical protein n=1 Tax=Anabaena azotica TaxID=197653 RepID=UPI001682A0BB|nr:hypothetical protein [Anabaena azotica]